MSPRVSLTRWRTWFDAAGVVLLVWYCLQIVRFTVVDGVQSVLWAAHDVWPAVPQVGVATLTPIVSTALWLVVPVVVALLFVGLTRVEPEPTGAEPGPDT